MVRLIHKNKIIPAMTIATAVAVAPLAGASAAEVTGNPVDTKLQVNVAEVLTISLTTPTTWASGDLVSDGQGGFVSDLLRNKVTLEVTSNNPSGYTASMYANNTNLENQTNNSTATIPTLAENTTASAFPADRWGYSFVDNTTTAPYYAMTTGSNPISLLSYTTNSSSNVNTKDVYFGAKASAASESGTYAQTVVFSVVSGVIDPNTNPVVPTDPTGPQDTETNNPVVAYDDGTSSGTTGTAHTVYTRRTTDASGGTSKEAHDFAMQRMIQAGVIPVTWQQVLLEWQRDWARTEHVEELTETLIQHFGGSGIAYLWEQQLLNTPDLIRFLVM